MIARGARFCNTLCASGFREDRRLGLIYQGVMTEAGHYSQERASLVFGTCAYCGAKVKGRKVNLPPDHPAPSAEKADAALRSLGYTHCGEIGPADHRREEGTRFADVVGVMCEYWEEYTPLGYREALRPYREGDRRLYCQNEIVGGE